MTEAEWLTAADPEPMLEWLRTSGRASDRKLRLFAVACCRRIWHLMTDKRSRRSVEVAERYAEGEAAKEEMGRALSPALLYARRTDGPTREAAYVAIRASVVFAADTIPAAQHAAWAVALRVSPTGYAAGLLLEQAAQAVLLRCIFGNPFRASPAIEPAWLMWNDTLIPRLAAAIYEERAFDRMPVLGDALEEAGCTDGAILGHCRWGGKHARGCWLVDSILGQG
jgi:hypothetical protein